MVRAAVVVAVTGGISVILQGCGSGSGDDNYKLECTDKCKADLVCSNAGLTESKTTCPHSLTEHPGLPTDKKACDAFVESIKDKQNAARKDLCKTLETGHGATDVVKCSDTCSVTMLCEQKGRLEAIASAGCTSKPDFAPKDYDECVIIRKQILIASADKQKLCDSAMKTVPKEILEEKLDCKDGCIATFQCGENGFHNVETTGCKATPDWVPVPGKTCEEALKPIQSDSEYQKGLCDAMATERDDQMKFDCDPGKCEILLKCTETGGVYTKQKSETCPGAVEALETKTMAECMKTMKKFKGNAQLGKIFCREQMPSASFVASAIMEKLHVVTDADEMRMPAIVGGITQAKALSFGVGAATVFAIILIFHVVSRAGKSNKDARDVELPQSGVA